GFGFGGTYNDSFELPDTESSTAQELLSETAGASESAGATIRVVWSPESGSAVDPAVLAEVTPTLTSLSELDSIACVQLPTGDTIGDACVLPEAFDEAAIAELPPEQQQATQEAIAAAQEASSPVSPDGSVAYATMTLAGDAAPESLSPEDAATIVSEVAELNNPPTLEAGATGSALSFAAGEPPSSEIIGLVVAIIILLLAFGSIIAAGLPIVVALVGVFAGLTLVVFAARFLDVATFGPTLAAMIGLGVGIDYALFVVNRFRQAKMSGSDAHSAAIEAVNTAGRAVAFAGVTVIIALSGLWVLGINFFNGLSVGASVTVLMVMLSALWLLPALLGLLGDKALGWRMPWARKDKTWHPEGGAWAHYGRFLQKIPVIPFIVSLLVVLTVAAPVLGMRLGFADDGGRPEGNVLRDGYDLLAEGFGPGVNGPFFVAVELPEAGDTAALAGTITAIDNTPGVASTLPTVEMLPLFVEPDTEVAAVQVVPETSPQEEATTDLLNELRDETLPAAEEQTGAKSYVGGFQAVTADFTSVLINSMPLFLSVVVGLGFVALVILFRSIVVPLTAAITSLLSLGAALGVTVAVFQWGWLSSFIGVETTGPIAPFLPVIVFAILFGLSMDYQVFLVSRMQEEWGRTKDNAVAVRRGLAGSGRVVAIAAAIMASVFLAFVPSTTQEIKLFGLALASAIIIDAFVVRLVMVPSLMSMLGKANWWLPQWLQRILPEINIEGSSDEIADDDEYLEPEEVTSK
ncbi:MAG: MMPL family transporter, partial [Actinomycetia bacterium]|nr:MMPL family transporter [Actinomycetes bacterium]